MNIRNQLAEYDKYRREHSYQDCLYTLRILIGGLSEKTTVNKYDMEDILEKLDDFKHIVNKYYPGEYHLYKLALEAFKNKQFEYAWKKLTQVGNEKIKQQKKTIQDDLTLIEKEEEELSKAQQDQQKLREALEEIHNVLTNAEQHNEMLDPKTKEKIVRTLQILNKQIKNDDTELRSTLSDLARRLKAA